MKKVKVFIVMAILALLAGCSSLDMASKTGSVEVLAGYRERIALGPTTEVIAVLEDVSVADAPSKVISEIRMPAGFPPFKIKLDYNQSDIKEGNRYNVRVKVVDGDELIFTSTESYDPFANDKDELILLRMTR